MLKSLRFFNFVSLFSFFFFFPLLISVLEKTKTKKIKNILKINGPISTKAEIVQILVKIILPSL